MRVAALAVFLVALSSASVAQVPTVHTAVFRLDYETATPERVYAMQAPYRGTLPEATERAVGALHVEYAPPSDFGYVDVAHALTGEQVFRASVIWSGAGQFEFPTGGSGDLANVGPAIEVAAMRTVLQYGSSEAQAQAAWDAVAATASARALADLGPVEVVVFDHFYTVGVSNPATAEWIVVAHTRPPAPRDLSVVSVDWPGALVTADHPFAPEVQVHNFSDVRDGGTIVLEADGAPVASSPVSLDAGETARVTLSPLELAASATLTARFEPEPGVADVYPDNNGSAVDVDVTAYPVFRPVSSLVSGGPVPLRGVPLDADGDGDVDVVQLAFASTLWLRDTQGAFPGASGALDGLTRPYPRNVHSHDFTGDGRPDLLFIYWGAPSILLARNADGSYTDISESAGIAAVTTEGGGDAADLDGDGSIDIVMNIGWQRSPAVFLNDGTGVFSGGDLLPGNGSGISLSFGDLDADGDLDLLVPRWFSASTIYENLGDGSFALREGPWPGDGNRHILAFDHDGDGDNDLLFSRTNGHDSVLLRNDGDFQFSLSDDPSLKDQSFHAAAADITGDGRVDIVKDFIDRAALWVGMDGGFENRSDLLLRQEEETRFGSIGTSPKFQFLDFDGDGDLDLYSLSLYLENQGVPAVADASDAPPDDADRRLSLAPNPAVDRLHVRVRLDDGPASLVVVDVLGRTVRTVFDGDRAAGETHLTLSLDGLAAGPYFLRFVDATHAETRPFTVVR